MNTTPFLNSLQSCAQCGAEREIAQTQCDLCGFEYGEAEPLAPLTDLSRLLVMQCARSYPLSMSEKLSHSTLALRNVADFVQMRLYVLGVEAISNGEQTKSLLDSNVFSDGGEFLWPLAAQAQLLVTLSGIGRQSPLFVSVWQQAESGEFADSVRPFFEVSSENCVVAAHALQALDLALEDNVMRMALSHRLTYEQWTKLPDDERILDIGDLPERLNNWARLVTVDSEGNLAPRVCAEAFKNHPNMLTLENHQKELQLLLEGKAKQHYMLPRPITAPAPIAPTEPAQPAQSSSLSMDA